MNEIVDHALSLLGLPGTGKSTYLAALDEVIETSSGTGGLESAGFTPSRAYLNRLREAWLKGADMPRTLPSEESVVTLRARDPASGRVAELVLPDIVGESFRAQCEQRMWERQYRESLAHTDGILLFLHSDHKAAHQPIGSKWPLDIDESAFEEPPKEWDAKFAANQAKVVELLQFIVGSSDVQAPLRVAVVISAWDLVISQSRRLPQDPQEFLDQEWPLVSQYLRMNPEALAVRTFGASARGGGPEETDRLLQLEEPRERVLLVDGAVQSKDLTRPIRWLLELSGE